MPAGTIAGTRVARFCARATRGALGSVALAVIASAACATTAVPATRDQLVIVGSSTVFPFSEVVAEHFARSGPYKRPSVRSTGTGDGFQLFCSGVELDTPDIANSSRRMSTAERARCAANGVRRISEVQIGYDSLILASTIKATSFNVTLAQLWRAVAKTVPVDGVFVPNPYRSWRDISPLLPDRPIRVFGPAPGHGTRDALVELVMEPSCTASDAGRKLPESARPSVCGAVRDDGRWVDVNELELVLGKLARSPEAVGILTYSYLEQFPTRLRAGSIESVAPTRAAISAGAYPISRPLFIYVKDSHLGSSVGLADYAAEFLSSCAAGANGYLAQSGLVPLSVPEMQRQRAIIARLQR